MKRRIASHTRVLILCEGVTEEVYSKALRTAFLPRNLQRTVTVDVVRYKKNDPTSLLKEAKERYKQAKKEKIPYSHVWLFFDHDNSPNLKPAIDEAMREGFKLAFTAISLEYWFILHFEDCGKAFNSGEECLKYLKQHWPNYHKTKINHFVELGNRLTLAIERAERLEKKNTGVPIAEAQPYTSVHELIAFFRQLGK